MDRPDIHDFSDPRARNRYRVRVKLRRGDGWKVKPEAARDDGMEAIVRFGWRMGEEDTSIYVGEQAWIPDRPLPSDLLWYASGDLEFIEELPPSERVGTTSPASAHLVSS